MKLPRRILYALSPIAAAGLVFAAAAPAWATGSMCTTNGDMLCTGLSSFTAGTHVKSVSPPGRTLDWQPDGGHGPQGFPTGVLRFTGGSNDCIRWDPADAAVEDGGCAGTGVIFEKSVNNGQIYHNQYLENHSATDWVLAESLSFTGVDFTMVDRNNPLSGFGFRFSGPG